MPDLNDLKPNTNQAGDVTPPATDPHKIQVDPNAATVKQPTPITSQQNIPDVAKTPFKKIPVMWEQTQSPISLLRKKLGGVVVCYYTTGSIVGDDVKYFYTHLKDLGFQKKMFFVLFSHGGDGKSAYRIASLLRDFCEELIIVIPEVAASAATMLSLAGDKIIMTPLSYLTAVDTSIVHPLNPKDNRNNPVRIELEEVRRAIDTITKHSATSQKQNRDADAESYKTIFNYIHPISLGAMQRTSNLSEMLCRDILSLRNSKMDPTQADKLIEQLNHDYPAHSYPITRKKAQELGLPVEHSDTELDTLLWAYINASRFLTEPVRTDLTDSFFHEERFLNIIESEGRRLYVRNTIERRLDPIIKGWTTLRDEYWWEALYEKEEAGKKTLKITRVDF